MTLNPKWWRYSGRKLWIISLLIDQKLHNQPTDLSKNRNKPKWGNCNLIQRVSQTQKKGIRISFLWCRLQRSPWAGWVGGWGESARWQVLLWESTGSFARLPWSDYMCVFLNMHLFESEVKATTHKQRALQCDGHLTCYLKIIEISWCQIGHPSWGIFMDSENKSDVSALSSYITLGGSQSSHFTRLMMKTQDSYDVE